MQILLKFFNLYFCRTSSGVSSRNLNKQFSWNFFMRSYYQPSQSSSWNSSRNFSWYFLKHCSQNFSRNFSKVFYLLKDSVRIFFFQNSLLIFIGVPSETLLKNSSKIQLFLKDFLLDFIFQILSEFFSYFFRNSSRNSFRSCHLEFKQNFFREFLLLLFFNFLPEFFCAFPF